MNRLAEIMGPAPSEMTEEQLHERLTSERQRVSRITADLKAGDAKRTKLRDDPD